MRITTTGRRVSAALAGLTVAGATAVVVATSPTAAATVDNITISGEEIVVGQTYSLHADLSGASFGLLVTWRDNGQAMTTPEAKVPWPVYNSSIDWTPQTPGQHTISLTQGSSTKTLIVNVGTGSGTTTPPTTTPPTTTPPVTTPPVTTPPTTTKPSSGSGGSGSGGSGSAGKILGGLLGSS